MVRKFEKIDENATLPRRGSKYSAGYDISAIDDVTIGPGEIAVIHTGLSVQLNSDEVLKLYDRSSNSRRVGIALINSVGIIDSDFYPNEFSGQFMNITDHDVTIKAGQRVMQGIFEKYLLTDDDTPGGERTGGFGSTGK